MDVAIGDRIGWADGAGVVVGRYYDLWIVRVEVGEAGTSGKRIVPMAKVRDVVEKGVWAPMQGPIGRGVITKAEHHGKCQGCGGRIDMGTWIYWMKPQGITRGRAMWSRLLNPGRTYHVRCAPIMGEDKHKALEEFDGTA